MKRRLLGFTLLEVMIAVVILAIGLSSLFTSEAGAIRMAQRARTTTVATLLARCKMAEIEEKVQKGTGWPTSNLEERDECCEGGEHEGFRCEWKVERIKLPDLNAEGDGGVGSDSKGGKDGKSGKGGEPSAGAEGKAAGKPNVLDQLNELGKDNDERMTAITDVLSGGAVKSGGELGASAGGSGKKKRGADGGMEDEDQTMGEQLDPIGSMVMGMAFPMMKPVIEEGVRRATVKVIWKEGDKEQEFEINQFLVSENQLILPEGEDADGGVTPTVPGAAPATSSTTSAPTTPLPGGN